jgi:putative transposase
MRKFQHNNHSVGQNSFHLVWCPKYRWHALKPIVINKVCTGILRMIALQNGFIIHELKVMEDHIHLFVELPPHISVSKAFQLFKGISSRILRRRFIWLRKLYRRGSMWSPGKFFRSVGSVTADTVEHYIRHSNHNWSYYKSLDRNSNLAEY